ncbi:hypothetical protein [Niveibacterium terrae]|uniref:hypothetical protein n=1 Tax=Niveibacterium terrae TaxID=3373598 RepID=UPI003A934F49
MPVLPVDGAMVCQRESIMLNDELLHKVLGIDPPWKIVRMREDIGKDQIDFWVAPQTGKSLFFGVKTAAISEAREQIWRHLNLGRMRCMIHAELVHENIHLPWQGDPGQPFTHAMSLQVVAMMRDGIKLQSICGFLDVPVADLWKFKHGLDSGAIGIGVAAALSAQRASSVPDADAPVWMMLLAGKVEIDIRLLSLKFLLTKMRKQMQLISDPEVHALKCYELHGFFARQEKNLQHELAQLARHL